MVASIYGLGFEGEPLYPDIYMVDAFSQMLKVVLAVCLLLTVLVSQRLPSMRPAGHREFPLLLAFSTLGMMMLVSATELLSLYIALEMSAYGLYIMAALHRDQMMGTEAGAKYVLFGIAASSLGLYGISLLFGATGTLYLADVAAAPHTPIWLLGAALTLIGALFKLAALPFHSWAPDTYEGTPHQVATFIGTASKVAAAGLLLRILVLTVDGSVLRSLIVPFSVASMTVGNLAALAQKDLKRMLGWSTVAHAGYLLLGIVVVNEIGISSVLFYAVIYALVSFAAFMVVIEVGGEENPSLDSLNGLYSRSPLLAAVLLVGMFGLAGIPPTPGFAGKWFLFSAAMESHYFWLVLVGGINATISLYYYLRVVKHAYLRPAGDAKPIVLAPGAVVAASVVIALTVVTGFVPDVVWSMAQTAAQALLGG